MRGLSSLLQDFLFEPQKVHERADRVLEFDIGIVRNLKNSSKEKFMGFGQLMTGEPEQEQR